jgi:hypothetical protein
MSSARFPASPQRRHLLATVAAMGLLTAGERLGLIRAALANGANPVPPGLHRIKGAVTVNGQPAREGLLLKPGDTVATGAGAEALYVIGQDAFLQRESSVVRFGADLADFMRVVSGKILSVFGRGQRNIHVATATIGIRGTACYIEEGVPQKVAGTKSPTYFCLCYGEAKVIPTAAPQQWETVITTHHDHPLYLYDDAKMPSVMVTAPVINHTDAELVMLENLVGRWPPFHGKVDTGYAL